MTEIMTLTETLQLAQRIVGLVHSNRLSLDNEKSTQADLAAVLARAGIPFEREARLSDAHIPDFMIGGLAVELKIKGGKMAIYRQLKRYAEHGRVRALLLVTNVAMGLPDEINGRPTAYAHIGKAWL